jgi:hypothetical protein
MATRSDIADGEYTVYITTGSTWMPSEKRFLDAPSYEKLEETMEFISEGNQYITWELTLETMEGETGSIPIDENDFPQ